MKRNSYHPHLAVALFGLAGCDSSQVAEPTLGNRTGALEEGGVVRRVKRTDFVPVSEQTSQPEPLAAPVREEKTYDQAGFLRLVQEDPRFAGLATSMRRSPVDPNTRPRHFVTREEGCAQGRLSEADEAAERASSPQVQIDARTSRDRSDVPHEQRLSQLPAHNLDNSDAQSARPGE